MPDINRIWGEIIWNIMWHVGDRSRAWFVCVYRDNPHALEGDTGGWSMLCLTCSMIPICWKPCVLRIIICLTKSKVSVERISVCIYSYWKLEDTVWRASTPMTSSTYYHRNYEITKSCARYLGRMISWWLWHPCDVMVAMIIDLWHNLYRSMAVSAMLHQFFNDFTNWTF